MNDDRRTPAPSRRKVKRLAVAATAASAVVLAGGIGLAAADDHTDTTETPAVDTTVEASTTSTTVGDTVPEVEEPEAEVPEVDVPEVEEPAEEGAGDEATTHPENHGAEVSEAAKDHSQDEEYGNHGAWVSSVARGEVDPEGEAITDSEASGPSSKGGKGKGAGGR